MKNIRNSIELVKLLDTYLNSKKMSRRKFCSLTNIPNSTIASWKIKLTLPSIEIVAKIADFMNVSLDDLVYKESNFDFDEKIFNEKKIEKINSTIISIYSDLENIKEKLSKIEDI